MDLNIINETEVFERQLEVARALRRSESQGFA
jgi:hypothetical protein